MKWRLLSCVQLFATTCTVDCQAPLSMEFSRQEFWSRQEYCCFLLQGIFPTQGSSTGLPHCRQILSQGSPRILERVAYPFSRGSSRPRNRTRVSCIVRGFFTNWDTREAVLLKLEKEKKNIVILETLGNASPEGQWSLNVLVKIACLCQAFAF